MIDSPDPQQWRLIGFILDDTSAEDRHLIPVAAGLSVLYGLNGAGKSRIIADIEFFWRGHESQAVALVQMPSEPPSGIDIFRELNRPDWFRDWRQKVGNDSDGSDEILRAWISNCIFSDDGFDEFPGILDPQFLDPDRDAKVRQEWMQQRLLLVEAVGSGERPEWHSAPALITGLDRPHTSAAADLHGMLDTNDDLEDYWPLANLAPFALMPTGETIMIGCVSGQPVLEFTQTVYSAGRHDELISLTPRLEGKLTDVDAATRHFLNKAVPQQVQVSDGEIGPSSPLVHAASKLENLANRHYQRALQDAPFLRLQVEVVGLDGGVRWHVQDDDPNRHQERALAGLSSAQIKWAQWSIAEAIAALSPDDTPRLVLLDEPESALHRSAESQMALYLNDLATSDMVSLLVATHSPELLDLEQARLFEVARISGRRRVTPLPALARDSLEQLGLFPSDLLRRQRGIILVEGLHDQIVLDRLFRDELLALRTEVVPLRGIHQLSAAKIGFLFDFTPAHVFVMLDNLKTSDLADTWEVAVTKALRGNRPDAIAHLDAAHCLDGSAEGRVLRELLQRVVDAGTADRLTPHGLSCRDIIEYLPVQSLVETDATWDELRCEHASERAAKKSTPKDFKAWLRRHHGADFSPEALSQAIQTMDSIPPDLLRLLKTVEAHTSVGTPNGRLRG